MKDYSSKSLFQKFSKGCSYFVETGCHLGSTIEEVINNCNSIERIYSCDINLDRVNHCRIKFQSSPVTLYHKNSVEFLTEVLPLLDKKSLFWLDAHGEGGGVPLFEELELISQLPYRDHNIMIDDIPVYFKGREDQLVNTLKGINNNYTVEFSPIAHHREDYICVAYLDND